jgi:DNA primase catalytic core
MARFTEQTLDDIRNRLNIVDIISDYVQLKKTGQGFQGLCPFHSEKSPSFHVHPEKQIFHCFGCHKGGNAFTFLMNIEGWNFPETVKKLAEKAGVEIPKDSQIPEKPKPTGPDPEQERLFAANEWAAKYYQYLLTQGKHAHALKYIKSRGLSDKTIQKFRIGVSPDGWNNLIQQLTKRGFTMAELAKAGLAVLKEDSPNGGYDRFRNRLMFPITSKEGHVIGFGARILEDDPQQPKYLNSSESALFSKRGVLYGLHENQRGIRLKNEAVVVEGYMDVVGLYEAGVHNAVATMGTAFTEEHCTLLRGLTRKVVTVFDPDKAGSDAARRSVHVFLESGIFAKDLSLPDEMDPDEFVLKHGAPKFDELCDQAPRQVTKILKEIAAQGALSEEQRGQWLDRLTPILVASRRLPDRALLWDSISLVLQVSLDALALVAEGARPKTPQQGASANPGNPMSGQGGQGGQARPAPRRQPPRPAIPRRSAEDSMEFEFFLAALTCPEGFQVIPPDLWRRGFQSRKLAGYLDTLLAADDSEAFAKAVANILARETDTELLDKSSAIVFAKETVPPLSPKDVTEMGHRILDQRKNKCIQVLTTQVKMAQRLGNEAEQLKLLSELNKLRGWQPDFQQMDWLFTQSSAGMSSASGLAKQAPEN